MSEDRPRYLSYLLRLWRVTGRSQPNWQASLESPITGQRQGFPDVEALFAFLTAQTHAPLDRVSADPFQTGDDANGMG